MFLELSRNSLSLYSRVQLTVVEHCVEWIRRVMKQHPPVKSKVNVVLRFLLHNIVVQTHHSRSTDTQWIRVYPTEVNTNTYYFNKTSLLYSLNISEIISWTHSKMFLLQLSTNCSQSIKRKCQRRQHSISKLFFLSIRND